jgi:transcriptional regulator of acetoin/glycerol metabolism
LVKAGKFREDLYFRLNGATVDLPPLRDRQDLAWIVSQLLEKRSMPDAAPRSMSQQALGVLSAYSWPGNIRELVNVIDFACAIASQAEIGADDLPDQVYRRLPADVEQYHIAGTHRGYGAAAALREDLRRTGWNVSATARLLGIDRTTLHRRMRRLSVSLPPRALE